MKENFSVVGIAYISGLLILLIFVGFGYKKAYETHSNIELENIKYSLENAITTYEKLADFTYETKFKNLFLSKLLHKANITEDKETLSTIRHIIYEKYKSDYQLLRRLGVKQLHIHLKRNITSFIRFHRPNLWGDSLKGIRKTIEICQKSGKPVYGFEEGRIFSGFRNVYPIMYNGSVVASVEISVGLNAISSQAISNKKIDYAKFILKKDISNKKVWEEELRKNYKISLLNKNFVEDKSKEEFLWNLKNDIARYVDEIDKSLQRDIKQNIEKFDTFSKFKIINKTAIHIYFIPFKDIEGNWAGYFVYYKGDEHWYKLIIFLLILTITIIIAYSFVFLVIYDKNVKILMLKSKDTLTGAWQRRYGLKLAEDALKLVKKQNNPLSVIFIDIDNFKKINDTYGHEKGDKVLEVVANIIQRRIRNSDIFVRYGGEELVVVLPNANLKTAFKVAEDIRKNLESYKFKDIGKITISAGVSQLKKGESLMELIDRADKAMYKAKKSGKNRVEKAE